MSINFHRLRCVSTFPAGELGASSLMRSRALTGLTANGQGQTGPLLNDVEEEMRNKRCCAFAPIDDP